MIFPLVIHSGASVSCNHLFISIASLSWMELNFLNQYPCMLSWFGVFQFGIFECCSELIEVYFLLRTFFESLKLFFCVGYLFSFSVMFSEIFPNSFVSKSSGCRYVFVYSPPTC